jgi:hypothetical protein
VAEWNIVRFDPTYEEPLDPEIIPLCDAMNAAGFETIASCWGHGHRRPAVWFKHSSDERIEKLARFIMAREQYDYHPFSSDFEKEIMMDGYRWCLGIRLHNCFRDTSVEDFAQEASKALAAVTTAVSEWREV